MWVKKSCWYLTLNSIPQHLCELLYSQFEAFGKSLWLPPPLHEDALLPSSRALDAKMDKSGCIHLHRQLSGTHLCTHIGHACNCLVLTSCAATWLQLHLDVISGRVCHKHLRILNYRALFKWANGNFSVEMTYAFKQSWCNLHEVNLKHGLMDFMMLWLKSIWLLNNTSELYFEIIDANITTKVV